MWSARFSESQLQVLKDLVRAQGEVGPDLQGALEALELARGDDLPEAELPWDSVMRQAELQGISEADVIWDMSGRRKERPVPPPKGPGSKNKRPTRRTRKPAT